MARSFLSLTEIGLFANATRSKITKREAHYFYIFKPQKMKKICFFVLSLVFLGENLAPESASFIFTMASYF